VRPYSQKHAFQTREVLIQGDSVRQIWGVDEPTSQQERKPLRKDPPARPLPPSPSTDVLYLRIGEELDYVRRMLDVMGDQLCGDPILLRRHAVALQSLDIVGQILRQVGNVIRSSDPHSAVNDIGMVDLKARLTRGQAL
jgi:hypothetical protein